MVVSPTAKNVFLEAEEPKRLGELGRMFLNGEEEGVPEVKGSKPKPAESKVR